MKHFRYQKWITLTVLAALLISVTACQTSPEPEIAPSPVPPVTEEESEQTLESREPDTKQEETSSDREESSSDPCSSSSGKTAAELLDDGSVRDISSMDFAKEMGIGLNLGNTLEAYWADENNSTTGAQRIGTNSPYAYETCWGAVYTTDKAIKGIREAGFSTIRIPVYWGNMMEDDGTFTINEDYIARVDQIISMSRQNNLDVVVNIHHYDGFLVEHLEKDKAIEVAGHLWTQIAEHLEPWSDHVIFEGYNEALGSVRKEDHYTEDEIYDYVNAMNQAFVSAVRSTGGNNKDRLLIVSGYWTNIDKTTNPKFKLPEDETKDRLMVSVHYVDNAMFWSNSIGNEKWRNYTKSQCELLKNAFTDPGIPVFMGECTAGYPKERIAKDSDGKESCEYVSETLNTLADYGFVPVIWDTSNNFYNRTRGEISDENNAAVVRQISERLGE